MIEPGLQPVNSPAAFRRRMDRLAERIAGDSLDRGQLTTLGESWLLGALFEALAIDAVRRGAGAALSPAKLLAAAAEAARLGAVSMELPGRMRRLLNDVEIRTRQAGAWRSGVPFWRPPLPAPDALEALWALPPLRLPEPDRLWAALAGDRPWLAAESAEAAIVAAAWNELENGFQSGKITLEPGTVGADGAHTSRRTDAVRYLNGREPDLLAHAPHAAVLAQWGLARLGEWLRQAASDRAPASPQNAMLARYPAPSAGYFPHLDNPGGANDNGRALTMILYLNPPERVCAGGELALWGPDASTAETPDALLPARGGTAVWLEARRAAHQVRPLRAGPPRWALTFWINDQAPSAPPAPDPPELTLTDALLERDNPPLPPDRVLFHELDGVDLRGALTVRRVGGTTPRAGAVCTVYRGGRRLDDWCDHHLTLGFDHLFLIFDRMEEPTEMADAERLRGRYGPDRLTVWSGAETAANRWPRLPQTEEVASLRRHAAGAGGSTAVSARQTLNASVALAAAKAGEGMGAPLDWLLHLDADEWLWLEGAGRGGDTLRRHFAAAEAAGLSQLRYLNHELLAPWVPGEPARFKRNPRLAAARLGASGWAALEALLEKNGRPYFNAYRNGKSAVRVSAGLMAAGVHGWRLESEDSARVSRLLAGPSILHWHFADPAGFRAKYLAMADAPESPRLFPPSPVEEAALSLIKDLRARGVDQETLAAELEALRRSLTEYSPAEIELLEEAGLLFFLEGGEDANGMSH